MYKNKVDAGNSLKDIEMTISKLGNKYMYFIKH